MNDPIADAVGATMHPLAGPALGIDDGFLAEVCHRVRTPLNGILGSLELLLETDLPEEVRILASAAFHSARELHTVFESEIESVRGPAELQQR